MSQVEDIKVLIEPILSELGIDLVDLEVHGKGGHSSVRVFVDVDGGISIDLCSKASRVIADVFDQKDPILGRYTLEVSSPGIDRPLKTARDFQRNSGRKISLTYTNPSGQQETKGRIEKVEDNILYLMTSAGLIEIMISDITLAKIVIEI